MKRLTIKGDTLGAQIEKAVATIAQEKGPIIMSGAGDNFVWSLSYSQRSVEMKIEEPKPAKKSRKKEAA